MPTHPEAPTTPCFAAMALLLATVAANAALTSDAIERGHTFPSFDADHWGI